MSELVNEYGRALADLAKEEGLEDLFLEETAAVRTVFTENPGYAQLISNPQLTKAERVDLVQTAFGGRVHPYLLNFMKLLTERGYAYKTADFMAEYERLYCVRHNIIKAKALTAVPLTDAQREKLARKLEQKTGKEIRLTCETDATLLGGIRLLVDNTLYDGSVRASLEEIRKSLASLTL